MKNINHNFKNRRAFTLVELIIVIAVIGVLAAILIPTFSNVIRKANIAKDISQCKNLNTTLAIKSQEDDIVSSPKTVDEVLVKLCENDYDMSQLTSKTKGTEFYWIKSINKIVLVDKTNASNINSDVFEESWSILYPEEFTEIMGKDKQDLFNIPTSDKLGTMPNYFSLNRRIEADMEWISANAEKISNASATNPVTVTVNSANQLAAVSLMLASSVDNTNPALSVNIKGNNDYVMHSNFDNVTIILTSDIFLGCNTWSPIGAPVRSAKVVIDGKEVQFTHDGNKEYRFAGTFDGRGHSISGLSMNRKYDPDSIYVNRFGYKAYTFGLFGSTFDATIKNVNMTKVSIDNRGLKTSDGKDICGDSVGSLVGLSSGNLTVENCTTEGYIYSWDCAGGIVARHYGTGDLTIRNCTNYATVVGYGTEFGKKAGGILGYAGNKFKNILIENDTNNGNVVASLAGGISAGLLAVQSEENKNCNIVIRNTVNNGNVTNVLDGTVLSGMGCGGLLGWHFKAGGNAVPSVIENFINNGHISTESSNGSFGYMNSIYTDIIFKGRIENNGLIENHSGSAYGASGMFGFIYQGAKVVVDSSATLKQKGDVISNTCGATGIMSTISEGTFEVNGRIEMSGNVTSNNSSAFGLISDVTNGKVIFSTGSVVKVIGDVRGSNIVTGVIGNVYSAKNKPQSKVTIESGSTVEVSGNIVAIGKANAVATGFIYQLVGSENVDTSANTVTKYPAVLSINGTLRITSPTISATTIDEYTSTGTSRTTISAGIVGIVNKSNITFGANSNVLVNGCNISSQAKNYNYKSYVVSGGVVGYIFGSNVRTNTVNPSTYEIIFSSISGTAKVQNCNVSIIKTATADNYAGAGVDIGLMGNQNYINVEGFSAQDLGGNTVSK